MRRFKSKKYSTSQRVDGGVSLATSAELRIATWNILADGMALDEFMTAGGDSENLYWSRRGPQVVASIGRLFGDVEMDVVVTQENDHPEWILAGLRRRIGPWMKMVTRVKGKHARKFYINRLSNVLTKNGHYPDGSTMCEFGCNGDKPGCSMGANCTEEHAHKVNGFLQSHPEVREMLTQEFGMTCTTNRDEYALGKDGNLGGPDDLHLTNDHITVYYNSQRLSLVSDNQQEAGEEDFVWRVGFRFSESRCPPGWSYETNVFPAHLKSGEDWEGEKRRVKELTRILDEANKTCLQNPVVAMDSNTGKLYQETLLTSLEETEVGAGSEVLFVEQLIKVRGFFDVVGETTGEVAGNQSFKMRHAMGGQPKKMGILMFDDLDKILVKESTQARLLDLPAAVFAKYSGSSAVILNHLRTVPELRDALRTACIDGKWGPDMRQNSTESLDAFLHAFLQEQRSLLEGRDGETKGDGNSLKVDPRLLHLFPPGTSIKPVLLDLYPHQNAPSDHPPIAAAIQLLPSPRRRSGSDASSEGKKASLRCIFGGKGK